MVTSAHVSDRFFSKDPMLTGLTEPNVEINFSSRGFDALLSKKMVCFKALFQVHAAAQFDSVSFLYK